MAESPPKAQAGATQNNPGVNLQQVTLGRDAERQLTREKLLHTHSACLTTAARAYSSEKHAPLQSAKRKQLTSGPNFFCTSTLTGLSGSKAGSYIWIKLILLYAPNQGRPQLGITGRRPTRRAFWGSKLNQGFAPSLFLHAVGRLAVHVCEGLAPRCATCGIL